MFLKYVIVKLQQSLLRDINVNEEVKNSIRKRRPQIMERSLDHYSKAKLPPIKSVYENEMQYKNVNEIIRQDSPIIDREKDLN